MMTTNLFAIANVKQLRTERVLEFYYLFSRTSWCVGVLNSVIFLTVFTIGLSLARFFGGPSEFRGVGGLNTQTPPPGTPLSLNMSRNGQMQALTVQSLLNSAKCSGAGWV